MNKRMKKRQRPKKWYEERLAELYEGFNDLHRRLTRVESVMSMYLKMKKDYKRLEKFIDKEKEKGSQSA
tara:strand:- start:268 stop:474 length:207 start_codon:yes stop_codon:yes gene_type:complete